MVSVMQSKPGSWHFLQKCSLTAEAEAETVFTAKTSRTVAKTRLCKMQAKLIKTLAKC